MTFLSGPRGLQSQGRRGQSATRATGTHSHAACFDRNSQSFAEGVCMREETKTLSIVCATVGIVIAVVASHGCEPAYGQAVKANVDPKADALLRKMSSTLGNTPTMKFDADHVLEVVTNDGE